MSASESRSEFFDICKGIGILCIYYGHTALWRTLPSRMIFSFHIPLFFLLSGMFFNVAKMPDFGSLMRKVCRNLLLPYCFFYVAGSILQADVTVSKWSSNALGECICFVNGAESGSIWFLVCLAMVQILIWLFHRGVTKLGFEFEQKSYALSMLALVLLGVGHLLYLYLPRSIVTRLPFMLASVPAGMFFFAIGILFKDRLIRFSISDVKPFLYCVILVAMLLAFVAVNVVVVQRFDIRLARFDIRVLPSCFLGVAMVLVVAKGLNVFKLTKKLFAKIGERSLYLFALELPLSYFVGKVTGGFFPCYMWSKKHVLCLEPVRIVVILLLAWFCSYPAMWMMDWLRRRLYVRS